MISVHIKPSTSKWHTRFIPAVSLSSECLSTNLIKKLQRTKSWQFKVGYNLLREIHANG